MIQAVTTPEQRNEFRRRIAGKPYFEAVLSTHLTLFGDKPGAGWSFYLLPGSAVMELRGGSAALCGRLPQDSDTGEELASFLRFLCVDRLRSEEPLPLACKEIEPLLLWELPQGSTLTLPTAPPADLILSRTPAMLPVSRMVFPDSDAEADAFYSMACTALAHGVGCCRALLYGNAPVCTVGSYEQSRTEAYMAAGITVPQWRGRGLAGWLICTLANELAAGRTVRFACLPPLRRFYEQLGFIQTGTILQYNTDWNNE